MVQWRGDFGERGERGEGGGGARICTLARCGAGEVRWMDGGRAGRVGEGRMMDEWRFGEVGGS